MLNAAEEPSLTVTGSTNGSNSIGVTIGEQGGNVQVEILGSGPVTVNNPNAVTTAVTNSSSNANEGNKNTAQDISLQNVSNKTCNNNSNVVNNGINNSDIAGSFNNGISTVAVNNGNNTQNGNNTNNESTQNGNCCEGKSKTQPSDNTGNPNKRRHRNKKHWSLGTALENGWDRFWSDLDGSSNDNDGNNTDLGNSNGDTWGNDWNDGGTADTSNGNQKENGGNINNKISKGDNNNQGSWW